MMYNTSINRIDYSWILDGFPVTFDQVQLLERNNIIPSQVFWLDLPLEECSKRRTTLLNTSPSSQQQFNRLDSIFQGRYATINQSQGSIQQFYRKKYNNLYRIDASKNRWNVYHTAEDNIKKTLKAYHLYEYAKKQGIF